MSELFATLGIDLIPVEQSLNIPVAQFVKDLLKVMDEIQVPMDIVNTWHIADRTACMVFNVIDEILFMNAEDYATDYESDNSDRDLDDIDSSSSEED